MRLKPIEKNIEIIHLSSQIELINKLGMVNECLGVQVGIILHLGVVICNDDICDVMT